MLVLCLCPSCLSFQPLLECIQHSPRYVQVLSLRLRVHVASACPTPSHKLYVVDVVTCYEYTAMDAHTNDKAYMAPPREPVSGRAALRVILALPPSMELSQPLYFVLFAASSF
jgi:hypothetical protein